MLEKLTHRLCVRLRADNAEVNKRGTRALKVADQVLLRNKRSEIRTICAKGYLHIYQYGALGCRVIRNMMLGHSMVNQAVRQCQVQANL